MKLKLKIIGKRVHEVGYRVFLLRKALELGMSKFNAYNTKENENQVLFAFLDAEEGQIAVFREFVKVNKPENAEVSEVVFEDYEGLVLNIEDYMHLLQVEQLSKGIPVLISIDKKQDKMLEKQDKMLEKLDEAKKEVIGEIKELRLDMRSYLDERLKRIESEIALLKAKVGLG